MNVVKKSNAIFLQGVVNIYTTWYVACCVWLLAPLSAHYLALHHLYLLFMSCKKWARHAFSQFFTHQHFRTYTYVHAYVDIWVHRSLLCWEIQRKTSAVLFFIRMQESLVCCCCLLFLLLVCIMRKIKHSVKRNKKVSNKWKNAQFLFVCRWRHNEWACSVGDISMCMYKYVCI